MSEIPDTSVKYLFQDPARANPCLGKILGGTVSYSGLITSLTEATEDNDPLRQFWYPSGLVRFAIDNLDDDSRPTKLEGVRQSADVALSFYAGNPDVDKIAALQSQMLEATHGGAAEVNIKIDDTTSWATKLKYTEAATKRILEATSGPILQIAICHGGLVAAMQSHLLLRDARPDSVLYPVRFSRAKMKDARPLLTPREVDYLVEQADGREVVVHDDDSATGATLRHSKKFFETQFGKQVTVTVNEYLKQGWIVESPDCLEEMH